jgi:hypothetical protein
VRHDDGSPPRVRFQHTIRPRINLGVINELVVEVDEEEDKVQPAGADQVKMVLILKTEMAAIPRSLREMIHAEIAIIQGGAAKAVIVVVTPFVWTATVDSILENSLAVAAAWSRFNPALPNRKHAKPVKSNEQLFEGHYTSVFDATPKLTYEPLPLNCRADCCAKLVRTQAATPADRRNVLKGFTEGKLWLITKCSTA